MTIFSWITSVPPAKCLRLLYSSTIPRPFQFIIHCWTNRSVLGIFELGLVKEDYKENLRHHVDIQSRNPKISSWIWSKIAGVSLFWVVQDKAQHRWKNHHFKSGPTSFWRCHMMVHVLLMFMWEWREFPSAPCLTGKKFDSWSLGVVEIARVAWRVSFQPM